MPPPGDLLDPGIEPGYLMSSSLASRFFTTRATWAIETLRMQHPSAGKESACNAGDLGLIARLGRSPREGNCYPLQYSGLENSIDCIVHEVTKSWTRRVSFTSVSAYVFLWFGKEQFVLLPQFSVGSRKSCWLPVFSVFYLIVGHSNDCQAPYIRMDTVYLL